MSTPTLPYTGERMIPQVTDRVVETHHWQRYLFFRPWYEDANIVDLGCGEGYGIDYAATFANTALGIDCSEDAIAHAQSRYPQARFRKTSAEEAELSDADLILCFQVLEYMQDPENLLKTLSKSKAKVVISVSNPIAWREESPEQTHIKQSWSPSDFQKLIEQTFKGKQIRFLSQQREWPGNVVEGLEENSLATLAVIGEGELPNWPSIGVATATYHNWPQLNEAIFQLSGRYPGRLRFAITVNGADEAQLKDMHSAQTANPRLIHLLEEPENRGFGIGMNIALDFLRREEGHDLYAVTNDDIVPDTDCLCELTSAMTELEKQGYKPGVVGPVSNNITGKQQVDIGEFGDYSGMLERARLYHKQHHSSVTQVVQLRGLMMLIHPDCLRDVGGFDPIFGIGNFEDDDHNLRCSLAGYSLWIAEGAFVFHYGSTTFQKLGIDYAGNINRNAEIMRKKWRLERVEDWPNLSCAPEGVCLLVPLGRSIDKCDKYEVRLNGEPVDLLWQATDMEFAGWVFHRIQSQPPDLRKALIETIEGKKISA